MRMPLVSARQSRAVQLQRSPMSMTLVWPWSPARRFKDNFTASVVDADGLANVTIAYGWQQLIGSTWSNISGATGNTFTLQAAQVGRQVRVRVTYTDALGSTESNRASTPTAAITTANNHPGGEGGWRGERRGRMWRRVGGLGDGVQGPRRRARRRMGRGRWRKEGGAAGSKGEGGGEKGGGGGGRGGRGGGGGWGGGSGGCAWRQRVADAESDLDGLGHRYGRRAGRGGLSVAAKQQRDDMEQYRRGDDQFAGPPAGSGRQLRAGHRQLCRRAGQWRKRHRLGHGFPGRQRQRCRSGLDQRHSHPRPDLDGEPRRPRWPAGQHQLSVAEQRRRHVVEQCRDRAKSGLGQQPRRQASQGERQPIPTSSAPARPSSAGRPRLSRP